MLSVFLFLPSLAAVPIDTRLGDWRGVCFFSSLGALLEDAAVLVFSSFLFFFILLWIFFSCFLSVGIYAPSPAPTLTLSHMLIWHFLLKGHGWIMFCRRGSSCYMKNDAAGVFSRFFVAIWTTKLHSLQAGFFWRLQLFYFAIRRQKYFFQGSNYWCIIKLDARFPTWWWSNFFLLVATHGTTAKINPLWPKKHFFRRLHCNKRPENPQKILYSQLDARPIVVVILFLKQSAVISVTVIAIAFWR